MLHLCFAGVRTIVLGLNFFFSPVFESLTLSERHFLFLVVVVLEEAESVPLGIHFPIALAVLPAFVPLLFRRFPLLRVTFMTRVFLFRLH
jgi:hypothetical protein